MKSSSAKGVEATLVNDVMEAYKDFRTKADFGGDDSEDSCQNLMEKLEDLYVHFKDGDGANGRRKTECKTT